ncbi:Lrp/AsnC ligand binding domain-containing protein [Streptomyces sp. NEAU-YJ-81]|uniref:Lrp/AsnC ligand binding domain-containing protein n=1 Tax=Streptomyces sp. NEAU-YJ-81 TaxID=2820288 RepID=UPI001ABC005A|nr:Lrp/AsnC ligand binding domain-containing protein [Streptomyces sp. NEAU-YJ-81]MBO3673673.1 hypothetical protein [Streptomyces sp. NEAU-YJ-81]
MFFLQTDPATLHEAVKQLTARTPVHLAVAVTGPDNLLAALAAPDTDVVYRLLAEEIPYLPGYRHARVHLVTAFVKESGMVFHDGHWQPVEP